MILVTVLKPDGDGSSISNDVCIVRRYELLEPLEVRGPPPRTRYRLSNVQRTGGMGVLLFQQGSTVGKGSSRTSLTNGNRFANFLSSADVTFTGLTVDGLVNQFHTNQGNTIIRGSGVNRVTAWTGVSFMAPANTRAS
jgi:hypothetical protein